MKDAVTVSSSDLGEVSRCRRDHDERPFRAQHAVELSGVARSEDVDEQVDRPARERPRPPHIPSRGSSPRMGPRGAAQRSGRGVHDETAGPRYAVEHPGQVLAGAAAGIDDEPAHRGQQAVGERGDPVRQRPEVPGGQERMPVGHHARAVSGQRAAGRQGEVAVAGDVERVPLRAAHRGGLALQLSPADRAQQRHGVKRSARSPWIGHQPSRTRGEVITDPAITDPAIIGQA
jgi:hypothetical protein